MSAAKSAWLAARIGSRFGDPASSSPFEHELDVRPVREPGGADRVEGRQQRDDRRLVVGGAAGVEARLGIEGRSGCRQRDHATSRPRPRLSRSVGANGGVVHSFGSSGWPS